MMIKKNFFGTTASGETVSVYELTNAAGACVRILDLGATVQAICIPVAGEMRDVVLGYDTVSEYEQQGCYFGVTIGRVANRIAGSAFTLNGKTYTLTTNEGAHCHHGGVPGFGKRLWTCEEAGERLVLEYKSPDGESGFPGNVTVQVAYTLTEDNELVIDYTAETDQATPINLTNHGYYNLNGHKAGPLTGHTLQISAAQMTVPDATLVPTGEVVSVVGTPDDYREARELVADVEHQHDLNYVLCLDAWTPMRQVASIWTDDLKMDCATTHPGLQLYTADQLNGVPGKDGAVYGAFSAFCLEAQNFPDAIHHEDFPNSILNPGEQYRQSIAYRFTVLK